MEWDDRRQRQVAPNRRRQHSLYKHTHHVILNQIGKALAPVCFHFRCIVIDIVSFHNLVIFYIAFLFINYESLGLFNSSCILGLFYLYNSVSFLQLLDLFALCLVIRVLHCLSWVDLLLLSEFLYSSFYIWIVTHSLHYAHLYILRHACSNNHRVSLHS